ncbi:unnamed protein product, partial [Medioppia subpectinata]
MAVTTATTTTTTRTRCRSGRDELLMALVFGMMLGGTPGQVNPNARWLSSRGMWLSYGCGVLVLHLALLSFPFLSVAWVWTLTNCIHNLVMFVFLHLLKGTPWESGDQGKVRKLTHWEQIDDGIQFTSTRKFLTVVPIILLVFIMRLIEIIFVKLSTLIVLHYVNQVIGIMGPIGETIPRYIFFFKEDTNITYCWTQSLDFLTEFKERKYNVIRSLDDNHTVSTHSTKLTPEYNSAIHFRSPDKQHNVCLLTQTKSTQTNQQFVRRYGCFTSRLDLYDKKMIRGVTDGTQSVNQVIGIMGPIGATIPRYVFLFKKDTDITYCWTQNTDFLTDTSGPQDMIELEFHELFRTPVGGAGGG